MATLLLADRDSVLDAKPLRAWLRDGWAVLFSHPDDYARYDMESDRWLTVVQRAFADRGVRPVALARRPQDYDQGWVTQVSGEPGFVVLEDSKARSLDMIDLRARALYEQIEASGQRFVMLIDSLLRNRKTFAYNRSMSLPSPLDFLGCIDALRKEPTTLDDFRELHAERQFRSRHSRWTGLAPNRRAAHG